MLERLAAEPGATARAPDAAFQERAERDPSP